MTRRVAIVTGAASGIGRAAALLLATRQECDVALVDVDADGLSATAEAIKAAGRETITLVADLADRAAVETVVPLTLQAWDRVDVLVNAAGVARDLRIHETTLDSWDLLHAVNLTAPFLLLAAAGASMIKRGKGGNIVNVSSSSAFRARHVSAGYASSKSGLLGLTRVAAGEFGPYGINVNAVAPGLTVSRMTLESYGYDRRRIEESARSGPVANLFGRVSEADDVANVIEFLCSVRSRQMTGQVLHTSAGAVV